MRHCTINDIVRSLNPDTLKSSMSLLWTGVLRWTTSGLLPISSTRDHGMMALYSRTRMGCITLEKSGLHLSPRWHKLTIQWPWLRCLTLSATVLRVFLIVNWVSVGYNQEGRMLCHHCSSQHNGLFGGHLSQRTMGLSLVMSTL